MLKKTSTIFNKTNQSIKIKNKNLNLNAIKLPKISIETNETNEINEKTLNISHKYKRKINRNDQFKTNLFNRNLYDGIFYSYLTTYDNKNNDDSNSKIKNVKSTHNILNLKKIHHKRTLTIGSNEEKKNQKYISPNQNNLIKSKKEAGVYDMLILDRFNSCFNLALKSFSNEK